MDDEFDALLDGFEPSALAQPAPAPAPAPVSAEEAPRPSKPAASARPASLGAKATAAAKAPVAAAKAPVAAAKAAVGAPAKAPARAPAKARPAPAEAKAEPEPNGVEASEAEGSKFKLSSIKEHAKKKGMWAGALKPIEIPDLLGAVAVREAPGGDGDPEGAEDAKGVERPRPEALQVELVDITRPHTPALLKIMDEIVVNATDHAVAHAKAPAGKRVTRIDITFEPASGRVSVFNDGPGIPVALHAEASKEAGRDIYVPEVAFAWFLAGTNGVKELTNVKGGINGLGAKLANVHSAEFVVETVDGVAQKAYTQRWRDRLDVTEPPRVAPQGKGRDAKPHTRVSFIPAYAELGYRLAPAPRLGKADADDLDAWLRLRAHQAAAYVGARVAVTYNGARCATTDAAALGRLLLTALGEGEAAAAVVLSAQAKAAEEPWKSHPWNVAVVVLPPGRKAGRRAAAQNMTIVNGVLSNKGSHVKYLKGLLSAAVEDKLRRATKRGRAAPAAAGKKGGAAAASGEDRKMGVAETLAGVRLVMCGAVPGADWGGQRKDELQVPAAALERYRLSADFLKRVGDAVAERLLLAQGDKAGAGRFVHDKYTPARNARFAAKRAHTYLMAAEGDSAITLLRAGLTQSRKAAPPGGPSLDWCGIISLQGVVPNAAREVTEVETSGGEAILVRSAKLQANKRLAGLADAMGLRYDRTYATPEERATLTYGQLLLCVDQDLDGTGKIAALVLVWVWLFWPELLRHGRVGRLMTPLVRMYPRRGGAPPLEFYYEEEHRRWLEAHPGWGETHRPPVYYKGLATHSREEARAMFTPEAFGRSIYTYTVDDAARRLFEVYFGAAPALRKAALVTPVAHLSPEETAALRRDRRIPLGRVQLDVDTKAYKNDAVKRQIPGAADGLNPARRKILFGAILRFGKEGAGHCLKVFQLGGAVADKCFYHHGDASLNGTITHMAQAFPGARRYPFLTGVGQFGSRHGDKAGSARYISVRLSPLVRVAFPPADRWHLDYVFEDGERAEPATFVPVVPMAVLESYKIVSEAWNHTGFARDLRATLAVVEAYIAGDAGLVEAADRLHAEEVAARPAAAAPALWQALAARWPLPAATAGFAGEVRPYRGQDHSFGVYAWDAASRTVTVTELPIGVVTAKYIDSLTKPGKSGAPNPRAAHVESVEDRSTEDKVELAVRLREGAFEAIGAAFGDADIDPLEDALLLRASLRPHLNYYGVRGDVLEFGESYLAPLLYWARLRRDLYATRLTRERIVAELRVVEETETLRYIGMAAELDLARLDDEEAAAAVLRGRGFPRLDSALLHKPEYTPNADLRALVTAGPGAGYAYLLNLRERDLVRSAADRRTKLLGGLRADLARVSAQLAERPTPGASVWRTEIAAFLEQAAKGAE